MSGEEQDHTVSVADIAAQESLAPSNAEQAGGETGWLLESTTPWPGGAIHWFGLLDKPYRSPRRRRYEWHTYTADPNRALRFRSKEEAEKYRDHRGLPPGLRCDLIATEHEWPPSSEEQPIIPNEVSTSTAGLDTKKPSPKDGVELREEIGRIFDPGAWEALGAPDPISMLAEDRRRSLIKADAVLALPALQQLREERDEARAALSGWRECADAAQTAAEGWKAEAASESIKRRAAEAQLATLRGEVEAVLELARRLIEAESLGPVWTGSANALQRMDDLLLKLRTAS